MSEKMTPREVKEIIAYLDVQIKRIKTQQKKLRYNSDDIKIEALEQVKKWIVENCK